MRTLSLAVCVLSLAAFLFWGAVLDLGFFGWDTYPLIAASRVDSVGGLFATLGEELMEGRFEGGHYWRPLVHYSFALDYALHGLAPRGYHVTDLGLLVAGAIATLALARRLVGPGAGAWVAAFVFLLHPVHFDVLPLPPRRADSLAVLFTLLALAVHVGGRSRTRSLVVGLLACAALGSKETGVLAPALVFSLALFEARPGAFKERLREVLDATWPALAALGTWAVARTIVLGGFGGAVGGDLLGGVTRGGAVLSRYTELTLFAGPVAVAALILAFWFLARAEPARPEHTPGAAHALDSLGVFLIGWFSLLLIVTGAGGGLRAWYALAFVPPLALMLGAVFDRALASNIGPIKWASLIICATLVFTQWSARSAPERWQAARTSARATDDICQRFSIAVRAAVPGTRVDLAPSTQRRTVLPPYALEAYAELALPGPVVRVEVPRANLVGPAAGEVLVVLVER